MVIVKTELYPISPLTGNYDRGQEKCGINQAQIFVAEAENPKEYSKSYKCPDYKPKYEAQAAKSLKMAA